MTIYAGTGRLAALAASPPAPIAGYCLIYFKADNVLYIKDSSGLETAIGTASAITQLTGEATAIGPGSAAITLDNAAVIGKILTGFVAGPNSTVLATDTILQAVQKLQSQINSVAGTTLAGDVTGPFGTTVVAFVGTKSALQVATSVDDTLAATAANTASTIVKRDASGNFSANVITANLTGVASGNELPITATTAADYYRGDKTFQPLNKAAVGLGNVDNTSDVNKPVSTAQQTAIDGKVQDTIVNGVTTVAPSQNAVFDALALKQDNISVTDTATIDITLTGTDISAIVKAASITNTELATGITADHIGAGTVSNTEFGYLDGVTSAIQTQLNNITGAGVTSLTGDVTGTGPGATATTVVSVGGSSASNVHSAELAANAATNLNTVSTIVKRDASGNFAANDLTVNQVNGVVVEAHASRHLPSGADPLTTAAPLVSLDANTTNSVGTANSLARSDHSHDIVTGAASTQTPNQTNAEGSSANLARADHVHNIPSGLPVQIGTSNFGGSAASFALSDHIHSHGAQTSGTLHAVVTTLVNGFMSFVDKVKLDLFSGTTPADTQVLIADGTLTYKPTTVSGDVTLANTGVSTIQTNVVSNSKLAQMPTLTIKGNNTGITADPLDLTTTQTTAILDVFVGDSGSGGTKGLVPAPLAGDTVANKFLKADGTFAQISSSGSLAYFLTNSAADIATYLYLDGFPGGATQYVTDVAPADTNILQSWVTLSGNPNTTFIPAGTVNVHFHGYKSGGTKTVALYAEIYKRAAGGAETLIVTTGNTIPLTTIEADLPVINASFPDTILLSTDRIVVKVRESITGGGSAPSSITIGFAGSTAARIEVPAAAVTAITSLTGDVSATGPGASAATVNAVGGKTSAAIATSVNDTIAATNVNTVSTIVKRDVNGDIAIRDLTARNITQSGAYYSSVVALTDAATIATDASLGNIFTVTLGGNRTLGAPTNPVDGQKITYRIRQDATGSRTLAFNAVFNFPASLAGLSLSTSINAFDYIGAQYNSVTSKWDVLAFTSGL